MFDLLEERARMGIPQPDRIGAGQGRSESELAGAAWCIGAVMVIAALGVLGWGLITFLRM